MDQARARRLAWAHELNADVASWMLGRVVPCVARAVPRPQCTLAEALEACRLVREAQPTRDGNRVITVVPDPDALRREWRDSGGAE